MKNSQTALHYVAFSYCSLVVRQVHIATLVVTATCLTLYPRDAQQSHDHRLLPNRTLNPNMSASILLTRVMWGKGVFKCVINDSPNMNT
eukprot:2361201-Prorocentrum_lima.AAC.1